MSPKCRNFHVCLLCKGGHSRMSCSQAKNEVVAPQSEEMSDYSGFNFKIYTPVEVNKLALEISRYPDVESRSYLIE